MPVEKLSPEKEPLKNTEVAKAKIPLSKLKRREHEELREFFEKDRKLAKINKVSWALREMVGALKLVPIPGPTRVSAKLKPSHPIMATKLDEGSG